MTDDVGDFTMEQANEFRRAIGELVRAVRGVEDTPDGQIETLGYLARDGAQSIADLARRRRIRHQSMSATVAELEAQGLARRSPDPSDARGVLVSLTPAGVAIIGESRIRRSSAVLVAAEALSREERRMLGLMPHVLDTLRAALPDG